LALKLVPLFCYSKKIIFFRKTGNHSNGTSTNRQINTSIFHQLNFQVMRNIICFATLLLIPFIGYNQTAKDSKCGDRKNCFEIPLGTPVYLESKNTINSSDAQPGDLVEFKVRTDVIVGGTIVIPTGATAQGIVKDVYASNMNEPGRLVIVVDQVQAIDGQLVKLSGNQQTITGKSRAEPGELKIGRTFTAEVASNKAILLK
jgi:hypothetical protein